MDDSCAVCAETLEWVAYGPCGHQEVCSTCVARLRCICEDRRCCICKSESSTIFVTKALGDFTRMINDFSVFPADPMEGRVGSYWYHEDTQAYFDDMDQYKMIKAMCRLSCRICDNYSEQGRDWPKSKGRFRSIEQLKGHLFHKHRLFMCSLCLEGRKIFICEQKLYTRVQLNGHVKEGDLEVDGSENERGGFIGHPLCEFCRNPFYGENELYQHMSTEHYTCHICQRQNPGQYEYYKNYDDLEIHFRQEHFLCEDESCLAKKFIVFPTESEIKRHNAKEHGGHMSRSKRNAALQIPTSFHYRRNIGQDRRGRGRDFHHDSSDGLSLAIQASLETANANTACDPPAAVDQSVSDRREMNEVDSILSSFESLARTDSEPSSKYREAVGRSSPLEVASFPPLPAASSKSKHKSNNSSDELGGNTIAACLRRKNIGTVKALNTSPAWPPVSHQPTSALGSRSRLALNSAPSLPSSSHSRLVSNSVSSLTFSSASSSSDKLIADSSRVWPPVSHQPTSSAAGSQPRLVSSSAPSLPLSSHSRLVLNSAPSLPSSSASSSSDKPVTDGSVHSGYVNSVLARAASASSASSSGKSSSTNNNIHGEPIYSTTDFPPVSATQTNKQLKNAQPPMKMEDVHTANKSLVEKIRAALDYDKEKFGAFKVVSADYRQDLIGTGEYLAYVHQFGLSHLILELAWLCPDPQKQKRLVEIHESNLRSNGNCTDNDGARSRSRSSSVKKSKTKCDDGGVSDSKGNLSDDILKAARTLQSNYEPSEVEVVEVLSKDGYRSGKGKSKFPPLKDSRGENGSVSAGNGSKKSGDVEAVHKQKKASKFLRLRLGEHSSAEPINDGNVGHSSALTEKDDSSDGPPVRGVWKNGGGQRLVGKNYRE